MRNLKAAVVTELFEYPVAVDMAWIVVAEFRVKGAVYTSEAEVGADPSVV